MRALRPNKPRIKRLTVAHMITEDLGYCCEWKFFSLYHDTVLIAARLGVDERTVRKHKARFAAGELHCTNAANCMKVVK